MNLIVNLLWKFLKEEKINVVVIVITSLIFNIIQTHNLSSLIANIIDTAKENNFQETYRFIYLFIAVSIMYLVIFFIYKIFQNKITTKLLQWIRLELAKVILRHNNEDFTDKNFIKFNSPVNRIASNCLMFISDIFTYVLPILIFIFVIIAYFVHYDKWMGAVFLLVNLFICFYIYLIYPHVVKVNKEYEKQFTENEMYFLEILNNMDKIVYMGQTKHEINQYTDKINETIRKSYEFYSFVNIHSSILNLIVFFTIFGLLIHTTKKVINKKMSVVMYITFISIFILYRDKMSVVIQQIIDFIEFSGRAQGVLEHFQEIDYKNYEQETKYDPPANLPFNEITFENVSFKYKSKTTHVVQNMNLKLQLNGKIIGITGSSGKGKTTTMKLILKMYKNYEGNIFIDNVNIRELDPDFIRKKIIYINQNPKLFDRLIIDNMMYGCSSDSNCRDKLELILRDYPKIRELFKDNDIYATQVGSLGEKMSGGQRVVISLIMGFINPSLGLILDEPTNGLDGVLKKEVLRLIKDFKKNKQFILIITHDRDVFSILDEVKEL